MSRFDRWSLRIGLVLILVSLVYGAVNDHNLAVESAERRAGNCEWFEGDHLDDVKQLVTTYDYFDDFTVERLEQSDFLAVFRQLTVTEQEATRDRAPDYCDVEGVALPEPDPCVPQRPPRVVFLAERFKVGPQPRVPFQRHCRRVKSQLRS